MRWPEAVRVGWESSPSAHVRTWRSPVLLIHGDDDRNVRSSETVDLAQRLRAQGVPFEEIIIPDDVHDFPPEVRERYVVDAIRWVFGYLEDPTKLMFGTDWPLVELGPYVRAYRDAVPEEHWDAVFYGNAARVFGF